MEGYAAAQISNGSGPSQRRLVLRATGRTNSGAAFAGSLEHQTAAKSTPNSYEKAQQKYGPRPAARAPVFIFMGAALRSAPRLPLGEAWPQGRMGIDSPDDALHNSRD